MFANCSNCILRHFLTGVNWTWKPCVAAAFGEQTFMSHVWSIAKSFKSSLGQAGIRSGPWFRVCVFIRSTCSINCVNQYDSRSMRNMWHKVPARISDTHTQFKRPLVDIRTEVSLTQLFFQNNNQDCVLCDLSSVQHESDPLDVSQPRR